MAKPRIFVSSTYFDLRVIRADLERFIKEMGYEPVLFERGHVPYGKEDALEEYCYREINTCDILIAVIGGKYGTHSKDNKHSITQKELITAIELGKQIYIFLERNVYAEYKTYLNNKDVKGFKPASVDSIKVFEFIENIYSLPAGNPIEPFDISEDIVRYLKEQWAGLFQRLMQESSRQKEINIVESMKATVSTLNNLVTFLTEERSKGDQAINDILLSSHPVFAAVKSAAKIPYRVVFYSFQELNCLLNVRGFVFDDNPTGDYEWDNKNMKLGIRIRKDIFDDNGRLKVITPDQWDENFVTTYDFNPQTSSSDDDIPF
jgi:hypothetical protein